MNQVLWLTALVSASALLRSADDDVRHSFKKIHVTDKFWGEGAHFGDFNKDGVMDVVSGPFWYQGPDFKQSHEYYPAKASFVRKSADGKEETVPGFEGALGTKNAYSENFLAFTHDLNGDGWTDILIAGFPGAESFWYENPQGRAGHWKRHVAIDVTDNESPAFTDLTGDGKPELVCNSKGYFGFAEPDWKNPTRMWKFRAISPNNNYHKFTHGLGIGDVNGDGRADLLEKDGWWEQPETLVGDPVWKNHRFPFAPGAGSSQMFAYDVNGDGLNDVITSLNPHGYGFAWYEQVRQNDQIDFKRHLIPNPATEKDKKPEPNEYGVVFSQHHAVDLVDMDGDGLKDVVTGKRFWAHGPTGDPDPNDPAVLYWFKLVRLPNHQASFVPFLIDDNSGVGTQVVAASTRPNMLPDIVVGNKKGTFVFCHQVEKVSRAEWEAAQPKRVR